MDLDEDYQTHGLTDSMSQRDLNLKECRWRRDDCPPMDFLGIQRY